NGNGVLDRAEVAQNLLVTSMGTDEVMRFDGTTGEFLDVLVPAGSGGLLDPVGTAIGPDGALYVSSAGNDQILRFDARRGTLLGTFVQPGSGGLDWPHGLVF